MAYALAYSYSTTNDFANAILSWMQKIGLNPEELHKAWKAPGSLTFRRNSLAITTGLYESTRFIIIIALLLACLELHTVDVIIADAIRKETKHRELQPKSESEPLNPRNIGYSLDIIGLSSLFHNNCILQTIVTFMQSNSWNTITPENADYQNWIIVQQLLQAPLLQLDWEIYSEEGGMKKLQQLMRQKEKKLEGGSKSKTQSRARSSRSPRRRSPSPKSKSKSKAQATPRHSPSPKRRSPKSKAKLSPRRR